MLVGTAPSPGAPQLALSPRTSSRWQLGVRLVLGMGSAIGPQWVLQGHPGPHAGRPPEPAQAPQGSILCRLQQGLGEAGLSIARRRETALGARAVPSLASQPCAAWPCDLEHCSMPSGRSVHVPGSAPEPLWGLQDVEGPFPELRLVASSSQGENLGPGL